MFEQEGAEESISYHRDVNCDGGKGTGHPNVYLHIKEKEIQCPYCSKVFVYKDAL